MKKYRFWKRGERERESGIEREGEERRKRIEWRKERQERLREEEK